MWLSRPVAWGFCRGVGVEWGQTFRRLYKIFACLGIFLNSETALPPPGYGPVGPFIFLITAFLMREPKWREKLVCRLFSYIYAYRRKETKLTTTNFQYIYLLKHSLFFPTYAFSIKNVKNTRKVIIVLVHN